MRDAASQASKLLGAYDVERSMRVDVYETTKQAVEALDRSAPAGQRTQAAAEAGLSAEALRFLERTLRNFRRNGLHLPAAQRSQVRRGPALGALAASGLNCLGRLSGRPRGGGGAGAGEA